MESVSLLQLQRLVASLVQRPETQNVWVTAELSDVAVRGGHCYMELLQKDDRGLQVAKARGVIWASLYPSIDSQFYAATGQRFASGLKVMLRVSASMHPVYGFSLVVSAVNPEYTLGDLLQRRREILERLKREGILNLNRELKWATPVPQRIAVISAAGAAGYGDFMNQLHTNPSHLRFVTRLFPAIMQGNSAPPSIIAALDQVAAEADQWDCVVIIRGGGATSDLQAFEDYDLAANVAQFPLPVVIGIGHERDITVLDYIANTRCKTPTAVAEFLTSTLRQSLDTVTGYVAEVIRFVNASLRGHEEKLANETRMVSTLVSTRLAQENTRLQSLRDSIPQAVDTRLTMQSQRLSNALRVISTICDGRIATERTRLDSYPPRLAAATDFILRSQQQRLTQIAEMVKVLSPEATLRRGYSITTVRKIAAVLVKHA